MPPDSTLVFTHIVEDLPVGIMVIDPDGSIVTTNDALSQILGFPRKMFATHGWASLFLENENNTAFNQILVDVINNRAVGMRRSVAYRTPEALRRQLNITTSFLHDEHGNAAGLIFLFEDATENFILRNRDRALLQERLALQREREAGLRNLALSVAHQIRNPITAITGLARLLKAEEGSGAREFLTGIHDEVERLEQVTRAVARYASIAEIRLLETSVPALLETLRTDLVLNATASHKDIQWDCQCEDATISVDAPLLKEALRAVLLNALEFCGDRSVAISVRNEIDKDGCWITVTDSGPGIRPRDMPFIFDPFFTTKPSGVGMGLCLARRIVSEHGGELRVESAEGIGTSVTLRLPHSPPSLLNDLIPETELPDGRVP